MTRRSPKKTGRENTPHGAAHLSGWGPGRLPVCRVQGCALRRVTFPRRTARQHPGSPSADPNPALPAGEWRAVWVSYLEWAAMDFSTEDAFRAGVRAAAGQLCRAWG